MKKNYTAILTFIILTVPCLIFAQGVNISGGLQVVAQGTVNLVVDQGGITNNGTFVPANSTVIFDGGATTAIAGTQPLPFYNVTFRGTGTKTNTGTALVIGTLGVQGTTVLDADGPANDRPFTIKSSDTATGRVDILTTGNVSGNVTVERYINTGTGPGQHTKSWQFLATPTTGQTIFQAWQEGGTAPAGFGTWITGTGSGFDAPSALPALKFYDPPTDTWTGVTNTSGALQNKQGYMLFVRGDRTVTTIGGTANNTNMRSKGVLFTPSNPPVPVPVPLNKFQSFGNPYASRIVFNSVYLLSTGINDAFYAWDPKLYGAYGFGGYQTMTGVAGYIPTAGFGTTYYPAGVPAPYIESGQAVFVRGNVGGNVNFNENCKVGGSRLVNKGPDNNDDYFPPGRQFLFTTLFTNTGLIADGNIVAIESGLGNELNQLDADKMINPGENFGILRDDRLLAVEARDPVVIYDTIFYNMQNLRQQPYQIRLAPVNITAGVEAFFIDRFNNSSTPVSLSDSSFIDFTITAAAGSNAPDRFMLVFRQATVVPVKIINIAASRNSNQTNDVIWKVENEINMQKYLIERSANGSDFESIGTSLPTANNGGTATYRYRDEATFTLINFYRIKGTGNGGEVQYSAIVKVESVKESGITVYPNPVSDNTINIRFSNQNKGTYIVKLINDLGQVILTSNLYVDQPNVVQTIRPGSILAAGTYQLSIISEDGNKKIEKVIVK